MTKEEKEQKTYAKPCFQHMMTTMDFFEGDRFMQSLKCKMGQLERTQINKLIEKHE